MDLLLALILFCVVVLILVHIFLVIMAHKHDALMARIEARRAMASNV